MEDETIDFFESTEIDEIQAKPLQKHGYIVNDGASLRLWQKIKKLIENIKNNTSFFEVYLQSNEWILLFSGPERKFAVSDGTIIIGDSAYLMDTFKNYTTVQGLNEIRTVSIFDVIMEYMNLETNEIIKKYHSLNENTSGKNFGVFFFCDVW